MMWSLHRWVWQLDAPVSIGIPPAGALNRCRLYVPARAIWAAITAERARGIAEDFPEYAELGKSIREGARFTYLYPAAQVRRRWSAWLPRFECGAGLAWHREHSQSDEGIPDRKFRRRLLDARPGTAIAPDSDSAEDGSLRETECVLPHWRGDNSEGNSPMGLVGYVFLKQSMQAPGDMIDLFLGGDTRYGLGRMRRVEWANASDLFGAQVNPSQEVPVVRSATLLAHAHQHVGAPEIIGAQEFLAGWDLTSRDRFTRHCDMPLWVPGSHTSDGKQIPEWEINEDGCWRFRRSVS